MLEILSRSIPNRDTLFLLYPDPQSALFSSMTSLKNLFSKLSKRDALPLDAGSCPEPIRCPILDDEPPFIPYPSGLHAAFDIQSLFDNPSRPSSPIPPISDAALTKAHDPIYTNSTPSLTGSHVSLTRSKDDISLQHNQDSQSEDMIKLQTTIEELRAKDDIMTTEVNQLSSIIKKERKKCLEYKSRLRNCRDVLECPVCTSTLRDPHSLSCGHVACSWCLQAWFVACEAPVQTQPRQLRVNTCPICRCQVDTPVTAYLVKQMIESLSFRRSAPPTSFPRKLQQGNEEIAWRGVFVRELGTCNECGGLERHGRCLGFRAVYNP